MPKENVMRRKKKLDLSKVMSKPLALPTPMVMYHIGPVLNAHITDSVTGVPIGRIKVLGDEQIVVYSGKDQRWYPFTEEQFEAQFGHRVPSAVARGEFAVVEGMIHVSGGDYTHTYAPADLRKVLRMHKGTEARDMTVYNDNIARKGLTPTVRRRSRFLHV